MSEKIAVEFEGVGKMYRLYKSRMDSFLDITSLGRVSPWWNPKIENFWALRNVSFKLNAGSRLGIIGRNGAGKTTLLKLMTGNISPTEGHIKVKGEVQALLEAGAGFHPEFSGSREHRGIACSERNEFACFETHGCYRLRLTDVPVQEARASAGLTVFSNLPRRWG